MKECCLMIAVIAFGAYFEIWLFDLFKKRGGL